MALFGPISSPLLIIASRLYYAHYINFTRIRKSNTREVVRWMMSLSMVFDVLGKLRYLTSVSPFYVIDCAFRSWLPFYFDIKVLIILWSTRKFNRVFGRDKDEKRLQMTDEEVKQWMDDWVKGYVKWAIFWALYLVLKLTEICLQAQVGEEESATEIFAWYVLPVYYSLKFGIWFSKHILKIFSGILGSVVFKKIMKPFMNNNEEAVNSKLDRFEEVVCASWIYNFLSGKLRWYLKRWKEAKVVYKDLKADLIDKKDE